MRNIVFASLVIILSCRSGFAQDFRKGFILKLNGDSVAGLIDYRSNKSNAKACYFKPSRKSKRVKYSQGRLKGFGFFDDKYYESKSLNGKNNDSIFFETLVKGPLSLYKLNSIYFAQNDSFFLLPHSRKEIEINGTKYLTPGNKYIGILNYIMKDCNLSADKVPYDEKRLSYLIQNFNRCKGAEGLMYKTKKPWTKIDKKIFVALDQTSYTPIGYTDYTFSQNVSMPFGFGVSISWPRIIEKSYLTIELWYVKKIFQGYNETANSYSTIRNDLVLSPEFLKIPVGVRYNFLMESKTPYILAGVAQHFVLSRSGKLTTETESNGVVITDKTSLQFSNRNLTGLWLGAGYTQKISPLMSGFFEARFEKVNTLDLRTSTTGNSLSFIVGLTF